MSTTTPRSAAVPTGAGNLGHESEVGVLLLNADLRLMHHTPTVELMLRGDTASSTKVPLDAVLPIIRSQITTTTGPEGSAPIEFSSGRRRYSCRSFLVGPAQRPAMAQTATPMVVAVIEPAQAARDLSDWFEAFQLEHWCHDFQLTTRESETVRLLLQGLSSKAIAERMQISPATVKSYIKMVMTKVGASTRTGIVAKMLEK